MGVEEVRPETGTRFRIRSVVDVGRTVFVEVGRPRLHQRPPACGSVPSREYSAYRAISPDALLYELGFVVAGSLFIIYDIIFYSSDEAVPFFYFLCVLHSSLIR